MACLGFSAHRPAYLTLNHSGSLRAISKGPQSPSTKSRDAGPVRCSDWLAGPLFLLLPCPDSGLELVPLELFFVEVAIQQDDVDCGVEFCTPEFVHLVFPE